MMEWAVSAIRLSKLMLRIEGMRPIRRRWLRMPITSGTPGVERGASSMKVMMGGLAICTASERQGSLGRKAPAQ
jgi:hypothetical protein